MVNQMYKNMLGGKSIIREQSEFATELGKKIGYENVFDYSLGNPSVPVPDAYTETMIRLHQTMPSNELHGYSPSLGNTSVRERSGGSHCPCGSLRDQAGRQASDLCSFFLRIS